jgi:hypothetical protein
MASRVTRGLGNTLRRPLPAVPLITTRVGSLASRVIPNHPQGSSLHAALAKPSWKEPIYKFEPDELDGDSGDCSTDDSSDEVTSLPEVKKNPTLKKGNLATSVLKTLRPQKSKAISVSVEISKIMEKIDVEVTRTYKDTETVITEVKAPSRSITAEVPEITQAKKSLWRAISLSKLFIAVGVILAVVGVLAAVLTFPATAQAIVVDLILKKMIGTAIKMVMPFLLPVVSTGIIALGSVFAVTYIANKLFNVLKKPVYDAGTAVLSGMNNLPGAGAVKFAARNAFFIVCPIRGR